MISLARSLNLDVVAEGVEEDAQAGFLRQCGCHLIQGHWAAVPMPPQEVVQLLHRRQGLDTSFLDGNSDPPALLIVDDEPNVLRALRRQLRQEPWEIVLADSAEQALEKLALHDVSVVLTDQRMPKVNGTELLKRVRQRYPDTVRLIMSAHADAATVAEAINDGAVFRFVAKPWSADGLKRDLQDAFRQASVLRTSA
jgi:CheY-like chemotaxis protein